MLRGNRCYFLVLDTAFPRCPKYSLIVIVLHVKYRTDVANVCHRRKYTLGVPGRRVNVHGR